MSRVTCTKSLTISYFRYYDWTILSRLWDGMVHGDAVYNCIVTYSVRLVIKKNKYEKR